MSTTKQVLSGFPRIKLLHSSDLDWIASNARRKTYQAGTQLISARQPSDAIYLPLQGRLSTVVTQPNGDKDYLLTLSPGDLSGETLFQDLCSAGTAIEAIESSEVLVLPKQQLTQKLDADRDFAARLYQFLAINLSERLRQLSNLMAKKQIKEGEPLRKVLMVFAILNDRDVAWMIANGVAQKASLNSVLIQQGESVPAIYLLLDGTLGIYISTDNNAQEIQVAKRVKGDILGEMSFVDGGAASATVKALENAWVLAIPQKVLANKLKEDQGFASRFYQAIAQIMSTRCQDLLLRGGVSSFNASQAELLSADIEVEDEIDLDVLEGTAIAGTRFEWMIQQLLR
jgi:CRP-like cAMP-binding protein